MKPTASTSAGREPSFDFDLRQLRRLPPTAEPSDDHHDRKGLPHTRQENIEPIPVAPSQLPVDLVNPPRRRWNVVNLDTVRYTPADSASLHRKYPARRYRKGLHLLRRTVGPLYRSTCSRPSKSSTPGLRGRHRSSPKSAIEHRSLRIAGLEPSRRP